METTVKSDPSLSEKVLDLFQEVKECPEIFRFQPTSSGHCTLKKMKTSVSSVKLITTYRPTGYNNAESHNFRNI